jgi:RNA polymerase sigma factor (sigma-70 family)
VRGSGEEADVTDAVSERRRRFDALFRENVAGIVAYCRWRAPSPADEEDAVAEVFLIAWRRLDAVPPGERARAWLYATARRVLSHQARANVRRSRLNQKLGAQPVAAQAGDDPLPGRVQDALAALSLRDREVLLLAEWHGLTPAEIATVMRCPAVTVRGRLHRARLRFRAAFESQTSQRDAGAPVAVPARLGRCEP